MNRTDKSKEPVMLELYDLSKNLMEKENIVGKHPELAKKLLAKTRELLK